MSRVIDNQLNSKILTENNDLVQNVHKETSTIFDYIELLKPRVMSLAIFTAIAGLIIAQGKIHPVIFIISILCTAAGAGSAGALNMWYDRDIDSVMTRTQKRPIVQGKILPDDALSFGIILGFMSVLTMCVCVNFTAGLLLLSSILFYIFIYTALLKRNTPQNIVIGGAAGSFPPMIGYASVTGTIDLYSLVLFSIIFFWTPPHFWALALYKSSDFRKAKLPMMPLVKGEKSTRFQILIYSIITTIFTTLPVLMGHASFFYFITSLFLNIMFVFYSLLLYMNDENKLAPTLFKYSILYLFLIFSLLSFDSLFFLQ